MAATRYLRACLPALPAAVVLAGSVLAVAFAARAPSPPPSSNSARGAGLPLETSPDPVLLGSVSTRQRVSASFTVINRGRRAFTLDRVATSCPCLGITAAPTMIGPREAKTVVVEFDPTNEPDFIGGLCIDVTGYAQGAAIFRGRIDLDVSSEHAGSRVSSTEEVRP